MENYTTRQMALAKLTEMHGRLKRAFKSSFFKMIFDKIFDSQFEYLKYYNEKLCNLHKSLKFGQIRQFTSL
jgi:hypothetical protein